MSEEARKLVDDFDDAVVRCAETMPEDRREFKDAHAKWSAAQHALLAYIERLERERDEARTILAHTDIGSLPNDWTLKQVAEARIDDLMKLRDQVRDTCARAAKAEAENARPRSSEVQALCFGFSRACALLDRGTDPRQYELPKLLDEWDALAHGTGVQASEDAARKP